MIQELQELATHVAVGTDQPCGTDPPPGLFFQGMKQGATVQAVSAQRRAIIG